MKKNKYQIGHSDEIIKFMKDKTIFDSAQFLIPYLKPNMKLLDCGCGPGGISLSFAKLLNEGNVVGIDIEKSQIDIAQKTARDEQINNVDFQCSSIFNLPFENNTFDIAFTHATLHHLDHPLEALKEMKRVIKPGGILAAREPDTSAMMMYPKNELIEKAQNLRHQFLTESGVDLILGRKLRTLLLKSELIEVQGFASCDAKGTKEALESVTDYLSFELTNTPFGENLIKQNILNTKEVKELQNAYKNLTYESGAFISFTWGEAIGFKNNQDSI